MSSLNMRAEILTTVNHSTILKRRRLPPPRVMTGDERRLMNPEPRTDQALRTLPGHFFFAFRVSAFWPCLEPLLLVPGTALSLAETNSRQPVGPPDLAPLRVLLISDIHGGIFLKPQTLSQIIHALMQENPDLVVVAATWSRATSPRPIHI